MATNGALLRDDDGSIFFVPEDVLETCRLDGELLDVARAALAEQEPEVQGFVNPSVVRTFLPGFDLGVAIGAATVDGDEPDAAQPKKEAGQANLTQYPGSLRPSRRRL